jgi:hypothetical protein
LKMAAPSEEKLIRDKFNLEVRKLSTKWKFQSFGRRERCFHWNQNGKWQIVVIWEHSGAIFVYISSITCAPCKTSGSRNQWNIKAWILKMYSRSAKGGEKGDPNRNPWLAKMSNTDSTRKRAWAQMFTKSKQFLLLIRHSQWYSIVKFDKR